MKRALALLPLLLLAACHKKAEPDAGVPPAEAPRDVGTPTVTLAVIDARIVVDAGTEELDASIPDAAIADAGVRAPQVEDAGAPEAPREPDAVWIPWDGGANPPNGVTDMVVLKVGATQHVQLSMNAGVVCDDLNIVAVGVNASSYDLTGKTPGVTHCKFKSMTVLGRYFEITVKP